MRDFLEMAYANETITMEQEITCKCCGTKNWSNNEVCINDNCNEYL